MADADHGGAQRRELRHGVGKGLRFQRAALGERLGIEIHHHRALLQRVGEREGEFLAAERRLRREVRRFVAGFERSEGGRGEQRGGEKSSGEAVHVRHPEIERG